PKKRAPEKAVREGVGLEERKVGVSRKTLRHKRTRPVGPWASAGQMLLSYRPPAERFRPQQRRRQSWMGWNRRDQSARTSHSRPTESSVGGAEVARPFPAATTQACGSRKPFWQC